MNTSYLFPLLTVALAVWGVRKSPIFALMCLLMAMLMMGTLDGEPICDPSPHGAEGEFSSSGSLSLALTLSPWSLLLAAIWTAGALTIAAWGFVTVCRWVQRWW